MNTPTTPTSLASAESKLRDAVASAKKRRSVTTVAMVIFCLILAGYLGFAYYQISLVDAATVVQLAENQADPYLNQSAAEWADELEARAPAVVDQAGDAALDMPAAFTERVVNYAESKAEAELPELESKFKELISELLDEADAAIRAEYPDGKIPDAEAEQMLTRVADQFGGSLEGRVQSIYDRYAEVSAELVNALDELGKKQGLTKTQQLHRELLESFLTLLQRVQANPPA